MNRGITMVPIIAILGGIILALVTVCVVLVLHQKNKESEYRMSIQLISDDYESKKVAMQQDYSKQMQQMQQHYLNQIQRLQDEKVVLCKEYENRIRQTQEDIENRKNQLLQMNEKELLVNVMIGLNGYGSRFDRLERHLSNDEIVKATSMLAQTITVKQNELMGFFSQQYDGLKYSINKNLNDSELIQKLNELSAENIVRRVSRLVNNLISEISTMENQLTSQVKTMNVSVIKALNDSALPKNLKELGEKTDEIMEILINDMNKPLSEHLDELMNEIHSVESDIERIKSDICDSKSIDSLCSAIDDIHESVCDRYGFDSIPSKIEDILTVVQEAKEAAESVKDIVESHSY